MKNEINKRLIQVEDEVHCQYVEYLPTNKLDERKQIWISEEDRLAIGETKCFDLETMKIVDYDGVDIKKRKKISELRLKREKKCFEIINRGQLWYSKLSDIQIEELEKWYNDWLNVTDTLIEPTKPSWLK